MAQPRSTQCDGSISGAQFKEIPTTKFVLCPVVDKVPLRSAVLYTGHK